MTRRALLPLLALPVVILFVIPTPSWADPAAPPPPPLATQEVDVEIKDRAAGKDTVTRFVLVVTSHTHITSRAGDAAYSIKAFRDPRGVTRIEVNRHVGPSSDLHLEAERALAAGKAAVTLGVVERSDGSRTEVSARAR
jgi:hypothetical protein